jgi:formylmethanofuran dehydrogenase subunit C
MLDGSIICHGNAGHYCASGYRGEKHGMKGGRIEVMGNAGDFCAEYLTGAKCISTAAAGTWQASR